MNEFLFILVLLVGVPAYAYLLAGVMSWAYFKAKLNYQRTLISTLTEGGCKNGQS